jgi:hypothetical protein
MSIWPQNVIDLPELQPVNVYFNKIITAMEYLLGVRFEDKSHNTVTDSVTNLTVPASIRK